MKFLMIMGHDDTFGPSPELIEQIVSWNRQMLAQGILVSSNPLMPWQKGHVLRLVNGRVETTPGSFVTSAEKVSAYALLDCPDERGALDAASKHPMATSAVVELRPVWEDLR